MKKDKILLIDFRNPENQFSREKGQGILMGNRNFVI